MPGVESQDVVYIHMFPREYTKGVVNLSPYAIKLETWLRLHKIPFKVVETTTFSKSTNQMPYILLNGEEYSDSDLIIAHLCKHYDVDQTEGLCAEEVALSRAFSKMVDEHTCWTYFLPRYVYQPHLFARVFQPSSSWLARTLLCRMLKSHVRKRSEAQGIGRKPTSVVGDLGKSDIRAISNYLGDKHFMMGDRITAVDCAIFGHLSQIVYVDFPYEHKKALETDCTNIKPYMERIRSQLWPDWDSIVAKGTFK